MLKEYEIPKNSKLYFGKSAKIKREIENSASKLLEEFQYEEIATPYFSYHQHSFLDPKELVRCNDEKNGVVTLRSDSTLDAVRLILNRLGRSIDHKKWYYIQPVFKYPTTEIYQIGAENIGCGDIGESILVCKNIFDKLSISPLLQISNIKIPLLAAKILGVDIEIFKKDNIEAILKLKIDWLEKLAFLQDPNEIKSLKHLMPQEIWIELEKLQEMARSAKYEKIVVSPLYYAQMRYYEEGFFRFIDKNEIFAMGGKYNIDDLPSCGFAIYTDAIVEKILNKQN